MRDRLPAAVASVIAIHVLLGAAIAIFLPAPFDETALTHVAAFARGESAADSWGPMEAALQHVDSGDPRRLYDAVLFEQRIKFQYPPTSLLALEALRGMGGSRVPLLLNVLTWIAVAVTAITVGLLLRAGAGGARGLSLFLLGVAGTITFYPVVKAYSLGQIQAWITALLALMLLSWASGRRTVAGVLLGLVCLLKPHFAVVGLWGLLRGERRFLAAAAATAAVGLAVSLAHFGLADHLNYLQALSFLAGHGESFYPNQSMNGLLHRLLFTGNNLEWLGDTFAPYDATVFAGTVLSSAAIVALALFWPPAPSARSGPIDLAAVLLAAVMASPIAWEHHYGVLAPIYALLAGHALRTAAVGRGTGPLLALAYLASAGFFAVAQRTAPTAWNPLQSYLYFGALITFGLLLAARARGAALTDSHPGRSLFEMDGQRAARRGAP
jgi:hypothetical protein